MIGLNYIICVLKGAVFLLSLEHTNVG